MYYLRAEQHWKRAASIAAAPNATDGKGGTKSKKYDSTFDLILASQRLSQDHHTHAMKRFKDVLKLQSKNAYALVGLGNVVRSATAFFISFVSVVVLLL
jgi:hypothetical protein